MPFRIGPTRANTIKSIGALSTVGFAFVIAVVIGAAIGYYLDEWLGTSPGLFLLFFFLGLAAGILNVLRLGRKYTK
jgi:ATP synthase protein I